MGKRTVTCKFPVARIKKIMQADDDVGKVAQATPIVVSKALEQFMASLVNASVAEAQSGGSRKLTAYHLKRTIHNNENFDFLKDIVERIPDPVEGDVGGPNGGGGGGSGTAGSRRASAAAGGNERPSKRAKVDRSSGSAAAAATAAVAASGSGSGSTGWGNVVPPSSSWSTAGAGAGIGSGTGTTWASAPPSAPLRKVEESDDEEDDEDSDDG